MDRKIPALLDMGCGYVLHTDHSVPSEVDYQTMVHWYEKGRGYRPFSSSPERPRRARSAERRARS